MSADRFQLPLPAAVSHSRTETAVSTSSFMACPLALCQGGTAPGVDLTQVLYQWAFQQAQKARQAPLPIFERDLFAVWN